MASHSRRRPLAIGIVFALAAVISVAPSAMATFPGRNGPITFMRQDENGFWQTWVARADLSHESQVTHLRANSGWSAWSPDGSRVAINTDVNDPDPTDGLGFEVWDIVTVKPDGSDPRTLTDSVGNSGDPAYSPDGKLIAFDADRGDWPAKAGIYVMNAENGSHMRRITSLPAGIDWDSSPRFSPDGKKLVFTRFRAAFTKPDGTSVEPTSALFVVKLNGSGLHQITPWDLTAGDADWSPDGKQIVFELDTVRDGRGDAYVVRSDGTGLKNLTKEAAVPDSLFEGFSDPVWSPDGR